MHARNAHAGFELRYGFFAVAMALPGADAAAADDADADPEAGRAADDAASAARRFAEPMRNTCELGNAFPFLSVRKITSPVLSRHALKNAAAFGSMRSGRDDIRPKTAASTSPVYAGGIGAFVFGVMMAPGVTVLPM
jgi:hypothetical protein